MRNLIILFFGMLLLFISSACERIIEPKELPQQEPRLVVNSILYNDSSATANVSLSKSILSGKAYKTIDNAVCDVYENGSFVGTMRLTSSGNYVLASHSIKIGKTYQLKVSAAGYEGVSGSTQIPDTIVTTNVERYDTSNYKISIENYATNSPVYIRGQLKFRFKIIDNPNVKNYYSIHPIIFLYDTSGVRINLDNNNYISSNTDDNIGGISLELTDETLVNGNQVPVDILVSFSTGWNNASASSFRNAVIFLEIDNASPEYYKYISTLNKQASTSASFFAEPTQVYSNMSNGMGIVAGASQSFIQIYP